MGELGTILEPIDPAAMPDDGEVVRLVCHPDWILALYVRMPEPRDRTARGFLDCASALPVNTVVAVYGDGRCAFVRMPESGEATHA